MKKIKEIALLILLIYGFSIFTFSQNLDKLPECKRDSILKEKAKNIILKYGKGYYREYKEPVIKKTTIEPRKDNPENINVGRSFYSVFYYYDKTKEKLELDFAAEVRIWAETDKIMCVTFGNGITIGNIVESNTRSGEIREVPYKQILPPKPIN